jgi:hypothetical protein
MKTTGVVFLAVLMTGLVGLWGSFAQANQTSSGANVSVVVVDSTMPSCTMQDYQLYQDCIQANNDASLCKAQMKCKQ